MPKGATTQSLGSQHKRTSLLMTGILRYPAWRLPGISDFWRDCVWMGSDKNKKKRLKSDGGVVFSGNRTFRPLFTAYA